MFGYKKVTEGTCLQVHSQKEKDDIAFVVSNKDQMPYIKDLANTIETSVADGKVSRKELSPVFTKMWRLVKAYKDV